MAGRFSHLLGCYAVDLGKLMEHSHNVTASAPLYCFADKEVHTAGIPTAGASNPEIHPHEMRQYDFPLRTNFCNTFGICSVLPLGGKVHTWGQKEYKESCAHLKDGPEVHAGLRVIVQGTQVCVGKADILGMPYK